MDFELTTDQLALRDGVRSFLARTFPPAVIRSLEGQPGAIRRDLWRALGDIGVFNLRTPEPAGVGMGMAEAVLVFEELGRSCVPGPLVATHLASGVVGGDVVGLVERPGDEAFIEHLEALDTLLVLDDAGVFAVDPGSVDGEQIRTPLDPLTPVHRVESLPRGAQVGGPDLAASWRIEGACLTAAFQLGLATALCDMAVAYAKERRQFDKPIGAFQAVKHLCADMFVRVEVARAAVYAAGVTFDTPEVGDVRRAVSAAKVVAGDAAVRNGETAIQVHGGIGFTWELDAHRYLKRAWVLDTHFGTAGAHAEVMASLV
jgi:alkylation response protein AidB-like acyl-CoA dehydrogenase